MSGRPRRRAGLVFAGLLASVLVAVLCGLGIWQIQRLHWKTDLIARVAARLAAPEAPAPPPSDWAALGTDDEYRRVALTGRLDPDREALVRAVTGYGAGYWVMTPLTTGNGWTVWINRGFVPQDRRNPSDRVRPAGEIRVAGLLRMSQAGGAFLRANDPAADRWYSRDTQALAQSRGLAGPVAPYFIDAATRPPGDPDPGGTLPIGGLPIGGLTVVKFRNTHLSYALTWFAMATGLAIASALILRREWRRGGAD